MQILHVVGARPNFMKAAPVVRALSREACRQAVIHTGQHYDAQMSAVFFEELGLPEPDVNLNVGSGSHAQQTAAIMVGLEQVFLERKPDLVLVYGDVNSTVAAALVCAKLGIRIGHVEAGLRSFDRRMPEEINRIITDQLADMLFTPSQDGDQNLLKEGIAKEKIFFVGNVMIDTLIRLLPKAEAMLPQLRDRFRLEHYGLLTLHRPSNVDQEATFSPLLDLLNELSCRLPLVFPVHPRVQHKWTQKLQSCNPNLRIVEPLSYLEFLALQTKATVILTDSGGIQEETTYLRVPCLTLRDSTERPITITAGTNVLIGNDRQMLRREFEKACDGKPRENSSLPPLWDGKAAERIADVLFR